MWHQKIAFLQIKYQYRLSLFYWRNVIGQILTAVHSSTSLQKKKKHIYTLQMVKMNYSALYVKFSLPKFTQITIIFNKLSVYPVHLKPAFREQALARLFSIIIIKQAVI